MKRIGTYITILLTLLLAACQDDDSFSTSTSNYLTLETDTLSLDTVFSTLPSPHKKFMVYNNSGDGIRITNVRQKNAGLSGFRVNVNGSYLSKDVGYKVSGLELRKGDSLRVFVEMTSRETKDTLPKLVEDELVFTLESGRQQVVNLNAWSWDAFVLKNLVVKGDTTLANLNGKPVVIFDTIKVDTLATLRIAKGTTLYFHSGAGIRCAGTLKVNGEKGSEVTMRCDRLDRMVSNLMYDNNPGQWGSIRLLGCSYDNELTYTNILGATDALICDSSDVTRQKVTIKNSTLHNLKGYGVKAKAARITIENSQVSNAYQGCLNFNGGEVDINSCTVPQYYPFDATRGPAIYFSNTSDSVSIPINMKVRNSLFTGYAKDVMTWSYGKKDSVMNVRFNDCQVRTVASGRDTLMFEQCHFEDAEDTVHYGKNTFEQFDTHYFFYDFTPKGDSKCIDAANPLTALPEDRNGTKRDDKPDVGCYEAKKEAKTEEK